MCCNCPFVKVDSGVCALLIGTDRASLVSLRMLDYTRVEIERGGEGGGRGGRGGAVTMKFKELDLGASLCQAPWTVTSGYRFSQYHLTRWGD